MKNIFSDLVSITRGLHRDNKSEKGYKILMDSQKNDNSSPFSRYKLNFKRPLNAKKTYYFNLINKQVENEINSFNETFSKNLSEPENIFLYETYFSKYNKYLKDINSYILKHSIGNDLLNDDNYIINYLKVCTIKLYIELQEGYGQHSDEPKLKIKEVAEKYFHDTNFDDSIFKKIEISLKENPISESQTKKMFKSITDDVRPKKEGMLTYSDIINYSKVKEFARLEEKLFENKIIDEDYNYIKKRGNKIILASFLLKLKESNFFNNKYFPKNKPSRQLQNKHITKFFAVRYGHNSDTNKEFRNFDGSKKHQYIKIIQVNYWLESIS